MTPFQAIVLGVVEGLTEYLPVSSTGHLILASYFLGLHGEAVKTFEIVIQGGAIAAVLFLYRERVVSILRSFSGREPAGRKLAVNLFISFLPALVAGLLFHSVIKERLFTLGPVIAALAAGGVLMILVDFWRAAPGKRGNRTLDSLTMADALLIGLAQCLALWPGTSRSMVTIVAGLLVGLSATQAAEYSFLLALPTLGAATLFDLAKGREILLHDVGLIPLVLGFAASAIVAALAVRSFLRYLTRRGLAPFGWYRIAVAFSIWFILARG